MSKHRQGAYGPNDHYKPGQSQEHFIPWVKQLQITPEWFIDMGPGCASEHGDARKAWHGIKLLGLEPSEIGYNTAKARWPEDSILLKAAVWDTDGEAVLYFPEDMLHSTLFVDGQRSYDNDTTNTLGVTDHITTPTRTLDSLDKELGPFDNCIFWMDIEGAERRALKGAVELLARKAVLAVNVEVRPQYAEEIAVMLQAGGLQKVHQYFVSEHIRDEVWVQR